MAVSAQAQMIGRARTVLVFRGDAVSRAVVSAVVARVQRASGRKRLLVSGPARIEPETIRHTEQVLVPLADQLLAQLGIESRPRSFELSVVNLGAASMADVGLNIEGFSADAAILLALLSAAMKIPLSTNLVATGHVASTDGDIRMVADLPAKLTAAAEHGEIERFICPAVGGDDSLRTLSPAAAEEISAAVTQAKGNLRVIEVTGLLQLIRAVWADSDVVSASLRWGFFQTADAPPEGKNTLERTALYLRTGNEQRFWRVLQAYLQEGHSVAAGNLLADCLKFHIARKKYPAELGRRLFTLLLSVPPTVRRLKLTFPLAPMEVCFALGRFAGANDRQDTQHLMDAVLGRVAAPVSPAEPPGASLSAGGPAAMAVQAVLGEISREALARKIGVPIDAVRAGYVLDRIVTDSYDLFCDIVRSFHLAMVRHTGAEPAPGDMETISAEAFDLLERAFAEEGGVAGAWAEARHGTRGGLRHVLDLMTERFKAEQQSKHVSRVVKVAVDPLEWSDRVTFVRELMTCLGPQLPPELRSQPPERFARQHEAICQLYARSLDRVKDFLRTL